MDCLLTPAGANLQNLLLEASSMVEILFYWTMSQMSFVAFGVFAMMWINFVKGGFYRYEKAVPFYEVLWTFFPTIILLSVAVPSMWLLYFHEQESFSTVSLKCVGHQWYWSYEYGEFPEVEFDSFMLPTEDLSEGMSRLLEVDNRVVVPVNSGIRVFVTSEDVIHAWTIPCLGIKIDATPGRLNVLSLIPSVCGVFLGQCSELCGANHSLMPIVFEVTLPSLFVEWLATF